MPATFIFVLILKPSTMKYMISKTMF